MSLSALTGWPPLTWLVIDGKHLTKPPKDWHPAVQDAGPGTAYIEVVPSLSPTLGHLHVCFSFTPERHPEPPLLPPWGPPACPVAPHPARVSLTSAEGITLRARAYRGLWSNLW